MTNHVPSRTATEPILAGFERATRPAVDFVRRTAAHSRAIARCVLLRHARRRAPSDVALLFRLAAVLESDGRRDDARACVRELADIFRARHDVDGLAHCYRRLLGLGPPEPSRLHRELAEVYSAAGRYRDAAAECRAAVERLVESGHASAAYGFIRRLPALGPFESSERAELEALVARYYTPEPRPTRAPDRSYAATTKSIDREVELSRLDF